MITANCTVFIRCVVKRFSWLIGKSNIWPNIGYKSMVNRFLCSVTSVQATANRPNWKCSLLVCAISAYYRPNNYRDCTLKTKMRDEEGNYLVMKLMPLYALMCLSSITLNVVHVLRRLWSATQTHWHLLTILAWSRPSTEHPALPWPTG